MKKKIVIPLVILLVFGIGIGAFALLRPKTASETKYSYIRTVTLKKGNLENVVSATGTVRSTDTSTVTSTTNAKVKVINVAVGDTVKTGDILVELDTADLLEQIADEEEAVEKRIKKANDALDTAENNLKIAKSDNVIAKGEYNTAYKEVNTARSAYNAVIDAMRPFTADLNSAQAVMQAAGLEYTNAMASGVDVEAKKSAYDMAKSAYDEVNLVYMQAKLACNYDLISSAYQQAKAVYDKCLSAYEMAGKAVTQAESAVESAEEALESARSSKLLDTLKEQLDACYLKAETDGKVTALSATVGSVPMGTVATIQNTEKLKVVITVSQSDVNLLTLGLPCRIESNAVSKAVVGTLSQLDPVSGSNGNFGAEVTITTEDSGLLIGMNADVDIILSSVEVGFSVPLDAVGEDETGKFVYRKTGGSGVDMTFEKVYVTLGESNDYYVAVESDELAEGDILRATADLTEGIEETTSQSGFNWQDMMQGNMPSQGNRPNGGNMPSGGFTPRG